MTEEHEPRVDGEPGLDLERVETLLQLLGSKEGVQREKAREELVAVGTPVVPLLMESMLSDDGHIRFEAAKALSQIGHPLSVPAFVALLRADDAGMRWIAAEGLVNAGPASIPPLLKELLGHPDSDVLCHGAHHALKGLSERWKELKGPLEPVTAACAGVDRKDTVPPAAEAALKAIEGPGGEPLP
jgi:HEAT repeat protein